MEITNKKIKLTDDVENIMEKTVTQYGNGAKLDCQKKYIGKRAYIVILKH
jgi:putative transposon-encoded protein